MGKSRKLSPGQIAAQYARQRIERERREAPKVYDRRVFGIADSRSVIVPDPDGSGDRLCMTAMVRDDPLARLHQRRQIDEAQFNAGRLMQGYYERAEIGALKAMDTTKEPVDGGRMGETLTEAVRHAVQQIIRLEKALGMEGAALARDVLGRGMFINQVANIRGVGGKTGQEYLGRRFRECLETLAKELHLA